MKQKQVHPMPALLSAIFPGLGQIIKNDIPQALFIWGAGIICIMLTFFIIGFPLGFLLWVWNIYDAYNAEHK